MPRKRESVPTRPRRRVAAGAVAAARGRSWWADHERALHGLIAVGFLWGLAYLVWRIGWSGDGAAPVPFALLLAAEIYGLASLALYAWTAWTVPAASRPVRREQPTVDIFVCTYDEPLRVLEPTLLGCRAIEYPHVTYVLDDGRRPEVQQLAAELGARYVTRPDNAHAKAGNVNHALGVTDGEIVLVLDADHVPHPEILDATLGYFDDPDVGLVQTPHDFSNRDSFQHTRLDRHEQSLFYDVLAPGKDRVGAMFWCGSAGLIRRAALESTGGVLTATIAEDFHTTIAMHARGWRSHYHAETLVQGLAPHDLAAFLLQRERWARGNLRVFRTRENPIWCRGLTLGQRLSYLSSLLNYFSGLQRFLMLAVLVSTLVTGALPMTASVLTLLVLWLPWAAASFTLSIALARGRLGVLDSSVYGLETMSIYLRGLLALVWPRTGRFRVTPKEGADPGGAVVLSRLALLTFLGAGLAIATLLRTLDAIGTIALRPLPDLALAITLGAGVWELTLILRTFVPLVRRRQQRIQFRFPVRLHGRIGTTEVPVVDLSPSGLSFVSPVAWSPGERPVMSLDLPDAAGVEHDVRLRPTVRSARLDEERGAWRIGCELVDVDDDARRRVIEFCYVVGQIGAHTAGRRERRIERELAREAAS